MIYVRTKPGRKLFYEGKPIPHDNFIPVAEDPFIRRLIDHWGDLEQEGGNDKKKEVKAKPKAGESGPTPKAAAEPYQPVTKN
jgi:hypothetical protein